LDDVSWEDFCDRVAAAPGLVSWRWAAVARNDDDWGLIALVVEAGVADPPDARTDRYPKAIVAVESMSAEGAAQRLRDFTASAQDADPAIAIPAQSNAVLHRVWGTEDWGLTPTGWPRLVLDARPGDGSPTYADPSGALSALGMTFYPSLGQAVAERVLCVAPGQIHMGQLASLSFRLIDCRGRIAALLADGENLRIEMEEGVGGSLEGFHLRLAWRAEPGEERLSRSDRLLSGADGIVVETGGVPAELFAALIDPVGEQVDQRTFDRRLRAEIANPETLEASVARWILEGEHGRLEYKQELKPTADANASFAETVAAFANGDGGEILIGIGDDGTVIGWETEKPLDRITNIIAHLVKETPAFEVSRLRVEERPILVVRVAPSPPGLRPHLVRDRAMIRVNATTRRASPAELRGLLAPDPGGTWAQFPPVSGAG
jgi:hypothetical protein